jgi:hypothetical protein
MQPARATARFDPDVGFVGCGNRRISVGVQPQDMDLLPDYGRIAARFERIAALARLAGNHSFAERLKAHAGQIREDLDRSPRQFQAEL